MNVRVVEFNKWFMLFCALLCIFLNDGGGIIILGFSLWILCTEKGKISLKGSISLLLSFFTVLLYIFMHSIVDGYSLLTNRSWVTIAVSTFMLLAVYKHIENINKEKSLINRKKMLKIFYDVLYLILFVYSANIIMTYLLEYRILGLDPRSYSYGGMHENDFAIIVMYVFLIGWKSKHILSAVFLATLTILFIPSRTFVLFILLFFICFFLSHIIDNIRRIKIFDSYFKIIVALVIFLILFAAVWVLILSWKYTLGASHEGIFETSNQGRFESILFAYRVILDQKLFFKGLPVTYLEMSEYSKLASMQGLHNRYMFFPHSSYLLMMVQYSVIVCFTYFYTLSKVFDRARSRTNDAMVLSYLVVAMIFHNMLQGGRMFIFLSILLMDEFQNRPTKIKAPVLLKLRRERKV